MASMGRSGAAMNALRARAAALRSRAASSPFASAPLRRRSGCAVPSALGSLQSLMPLHSAVASARLRSCIASHSSYWSCLSQGLNKRI